MALEKEQERLEQVAAVKAKRAPLGFGRLSAS